MVLLVDQSNSRAAQIYSRILLRAFFKLHICLAVFHLPGFYPFITLLFFKADIKAWTTLAGVWVLQHWHLLVGSSFTDAAAWEQFTDKKCFQCWTVLCLWLYRHKLFFLFFLFSALIIFIVYPGWCIFHCCLAARAVGSNSDFILGVSMFFLCLSGSLWIFSLPLKVKNQYKQKNTTFIWIIIIVPKDVVFTFFFFMSSIHSFAPLWGTHNSPEWTLPLTQYILLNQCRYKFTTPTFSCTPKKKNKYLFTWMV